MKDSHEGLTCFRNAIFITGGHTTWNPTDPCQWQGALTSSCGVTIFLTPLQMCSWVDLQQPVNSTSWVSASSALASYKTKTPGMRRCSIGKCFPNKHKKLNSILRALGDKSVIVAQASDPSPEMGTGRSLGLTYQPA